MHCIILDCAKTRAMKTEVGLLKLVLVINVPSTLRRQVPVKDYQI